VQEAFREFATYAFGVEELRRRMATKGLKCSRNNFHLLLRNKTYIGKILVPAYGNEPSYYTDGIHEPLIEKSLFDEVQDALSGRFPNRPTKNTLKEELPLRGLLECRLCGKNLSGSASRGNGGKYYYYHCTCGCKERFAAELANNAFMKEFSKLTFNEAALELNYEILKDDFESRNKQVFEEL